MKTLEFIEPAATESFRDKISTVDKEGKRVWIYPKKPKGKLTSLRSYISWFFFALFFAVPFLRMQGEPVVLINVIERKFIFFGSIFWPQDFHLFLIATLVFIIFIVVFTVAYGRVFCGWVCPQTLFMEMFFRKIEYLIEGDYKAQQALDKESLSINKVFKKTFKHLIFIAASFIISNTFLMYIIGSEEWLNIIKEPLGTHISGFISIVVFTGAFYTVFARFREQVCTTICPYGRLQGVLIDKKTIVVAYDYKRGEPKGKFRKNEDRKQAGKGDCIDCNLCTVVCPT
ncbi:MAG: 4Fe-4S binding protein, partial [Cytophagaceae bacterium]|nr:4Fe-4S binding protein [Cytophagaceae bacterium]